MTAQIVPEAPVPCDVEAEQRLLGCILLDQRKVPEVSARGGEHLFYDAAHKAIFREIAARDKAGAIASPVTLARVSSLLPVLEEVGGPAYLVRLAGVAMASGFPHFMDILVEARSRRDLLDVVRKAQTALIDGSEPASDVAAKLEAAGAITPQSAHAPKPVSMTAAVTIALEQVNSAYRGDEIANVKSGIGRLDDMISGFYPGDMILLGGRPSMGKTGVALSIGLNSARAGHPVIFASLEMMPEAMALRAISEGTGHNPGGAVSYASARRGEMTEGQFRSLIAATEEVSKLPIFFLPKQYGESSMLMSGVKRVLSQYHGDRLPLVIVDYLQLMRNDGANRYEKITAISQDMKDLAMRLECPVMALSQLSRQVEQRDDKRPQLSDLRESGQLEQDADTILFCYREEYYLQREEPDVSEDAHADWRMAIERARNRLDIIVAKQRQGETGTARVRFNPALNLVWED